jgi:hypothetical protein
MNSLSGGNLFPTISMTRPDFPPIERRLSATARAQARRAFRRRFDASNRALAGAGASSDQQRCLGSRQNSKSSGWRVIQEQSGQSRPRSHSLKLLMI